MEKLKELIGDFISLVYPHYCAACGKTLYKHESSICTVCRFQLPETNFHEQRDNKVEEVFWGRVPITAGASFFHFDKGGKVQKLIHQLKYKGQKEVGEELGRWYGSKLNKAKPFHTVDYIVPVPLHTSKFRSRGYNQSECFASGLGEVMEIEVETKNLYRAIANPTQTKKSRYERWQNVEGIFKLKNSSTFKNKHILLVDDVISTGSTIEACAQTLLLAENSKVSVASIAIA